MGLRNNVLIVAVTLGACSNATTSTSKTASNTTTPPLTGQELLTRMHDMYAGKWYETLTFVQKTTVHRPNQPERIETWYESLLSPGRLRIDFDDPAKGNGVIYTPDSMYVVRDSKVVRANASGNPFLPFVAGVYAQPLAETLRQLAPYKIDLTAVHADTWQGKPVWVVGSKGPEDLTSPQFWVDPHTLVAVRMILALAPQPGAPPFDIHLDNYVPVGGGLLATKVVMLQNGAQVQLEEYSDWKGNVKLAPEFFDAARWSSANHWALTPK